MTFAQRRNRLTTHFSDCISVVKRRVSIPQNLHNNLGGLANHLLLFFHVCPAQLGTLTGVALCHKKLGEPRCKVFPTSSTRMRLLTFIPELLGSNLYGTLLSRNFTHFPQIKHTKPPLKWISCTTRIKQYTVYRSGSQNVTAHGAQSI